MVQRVLPRQRQPPVRCCMGIRIVILSCLCAGVTACGSDSPRFTLVGDSATIWTASNEPAAREFIGSEWDTLAIRTDTMLLYPSRLDGNDSLVVVFDAADSRIVAFDSRGQLLWTHGRKGQGPGEYANVRDIDLRSDLSTLVLDAATSRLSTISPRGELVSTMTLTLPGAPQQLVPLADGTYIVLSIGERLDLTRIGRNGNTLEPIQVPWEGWSTIAPLAAQALLDGPLAESTWVLGFVFGNGWFAFDGARPKEYVGKYIEHTNFPAVLKEAGELSYRLGKAIKSGGDLSAADGRLHVLFGGATELKGRLIDQYDLDEGRYLGTLELPNRAALVKALSSRRFVVVEYEPAPRLWIGRIRNE